MLEHNFKKCSLGKCGNTNRNATDKNGNGCGTYTRAANCGMHDDEDFDSNKMCCNCGGGGFGTRINDSAKCLNL